MLRLKTRVKEVKKIRKIQEKTIETNADDYMIGLFNGLEMAVAILENREPEFIVTTKEPKVVEHEEEQYGRTIASGIKRKGSAEYERCDTENT